MLYEKNAFENAGEPKGLWSDELRAFKQISIDFNRFKSCADLVKRNLANSQTLIENIGDTLTALQSIKCHEMVEQFKNFINSGLFRYLAQDGELSSLCQSHSPQGKIRDLFIQVGAPLPETSNRKSLFALCYEEEMEAINCCSLEGKCKGDDFSLASLENSEEMCSSGHQAAIENLSKTIEQRCPEYVKVCNENCLSELQTFKQNMLEVFVIPHLRVEGVLRNDPCHEKIRSIREAYQDNSRKKESGGGHRLLLNSDISEIVDCEVAFEEMKNNEEVKRSLKESMEELCKERAENQAKDGDRLDTSSFNSNIHNPTRTADTSRDRTRSSPTRRSPGSVDDDVEFPENERDREILTESDFTADGDTQDTDGENGLNNPFGGNGNPDDETVAEDDRDDEIDWSSEPCCNGVCDSSIDSLCNWDSFFCEAEGRFKSSESREVRSFSFSGVDGGN